MRTTSLFLIISFVGVSISVSVFGASAPDNYKKLCASCHGDYMQGGSGPSLQDKQWEHGGSDTQIAQSILKGRGLGMPAFSKTLTAEDTRALVIFIRESQYYANYQKQRVQRDQTFNAAGEQFTVLPFVEGMKDLWAMDFLPHGGVIFTHKKGELYTQALGGQPVLIKGTPKVWYVKQAGLFDVKVHPDYKSNGWIYLSFAEKTKAGGMTRFVRGRIKENRWIDQQDIYVAPEKHYTPAKGHFGSRFIFSEGYVYFGIGDRFKSKNAQSLKNPAGKIHRLHDDGRVPTDNPFVSVKGAIPSIYSYGNRNPQGLTLQPGSHKVWASEHGPRGGDEINLIEKGLNYGWPVITYGMNYDGTPWTSETEREGMLQPKHHWVPSIAVSQIDFYQGDVFPNWKNKLIVASLALQELRLLTIKNDAVTDDALLFKNLGRMRDINVSPDGIPHVIFTGKRGGIYKLVSAGKVKK